MTQNCLSNDTGKKREKEKVMAVNTQHVAFISIQEY